LYFEVALGNGVCITPQNEILKSNTRIKLIPIRPTITACASWMQTTNNPYIRSFLDFLSARKWELYE
jgi:DNA-binding transcriptional LysR family regulator